MKKMKSNYVMTKDEFDAMKSMEDSVRQLINDLVKTGNHTMLRNWDRNRGTNAKFPVIER